MTKMTHGEATEYFDYLVKEKGFTPQEANEYMGEKVQVDSEGVWDKTKQVAASGLDLLGRGLDYAGGLSRTAIADTFMDADKVTTDDWAKAVRGKAPDSEEYLGRAGVGKMGSVDVPIIGEVTGRDAAGFAMDVAADPLTWLSFGAAPLAKHATKSGIVGKLSKAVVDIDKAANLPGDLVAKVGKKTYKSGLKGIDEVAAKFGKEPVSDFLLEKNIWGRGKTIQKAMDDIGDQALLNRDDILRRATRAGAEVDLDEAVAATRKRIGQIKADKNTKLFPLAEQLQEEVDRYMALKPKSSEHVIRELPFTAWQGGQTPVTFAPGNSVVSGSPTKRIQTGVGPFGDPVFKDVPAVMNVTERNQGRFIPGAEVPDQLISQKPLKVLDVSNPGVAADGRLLDITGVTPVQGTKIKTTAGVDIPQSAYNDYALLDASTAANKEIQGGFKRAVETSVGNTLGDEAKEKLIKENDIIGRVLTTREKAALEAAKEARKNAVTQVDGILLGASPGVAAWKKAAEILQMTPVRTGSGVLMHELGTNKKLKPLTSGVLRQIPRELRDEEMSPWMWLP